MRVLASLLVMVGLLLIVWPSVEQARHTQHQTELVDQFQTMNDHLKTRRTVEATEETEGLSRHDVLGLLHINQLDLTLPLIDDVSEAALDVGAGLIRGDQQFGEIGNIGVAAHRSRTKGRLFSELDQLTEGDVVEIQTTDGTIEYEVFRQRIVKPSQTSVLDTIDDESIITLITCTLDGDKRIIVQAKQTTARSQ
ncbi:sortase A [Alkalibacillus flavidus]|uniref:Sortase A n=1 Tax=Alkalibacillus flavidus TaxID=546021 RepID=A0ABV2KX88_9BACI